MSHPERIWLIDHEKDDRRVIGWTPVEPLEEDAAAVEYVRADQLARARALVEADAEEDADVPLAELIQGHFDAYEAEIQRLRNGISRLEKRDGRTGPEEGAL